METYLFRILVGLSLLFALPTEAAIKPVQETYENEITSVVRNKYYYKPGKFELGLLAGVMPYDSLVNHYLVGGRLSWHLTDHFGWEIVDYQYLMPSVTSFSTNLVSANGISNLDVVKIKQMVGTNFILSPLYGKIRFIGRQVLYFDIYIVAGGGAASTDVVNISAPAVAGAVTQVVTKAGWDPAFDFGFGFKVFVSDSVGFVMDLRDYVVYSRTYGTSSLKSNFSVFAGLSVFLPGF